MSEKSESNEVDLTLGFGGEVVGKAVVKEDGTVEASLTDKGAKKVFPDWNSTEGLSVYEPVKEDVMGSYLPEDISLLEAYYRHRPKGTFDA